MTRQFNEDLLSDLARQRVVLFLGAGVSASAITASGKRIAGWPKFLMNCAEEITGDFKEQILEILRSRDYLLACELLQKYFADDWEDIVSKEFGQQATPSKLHISLLRLRQRIIVTTNFDKLIEHAWANFTEGGTHLPKVISGVDDRVFRSLKDHDGKYVIKIHGTFDESDSVVFSRSEYIRLAFGNENYKSFLESLLLNYTFIYVGFSMDDPAITLLMEMYAFKYRNARPHYIIASDVIKENIIEINKRLRKLIVITYNSEKNHEELPDLLEDLGRQSLNKLRSIVGDMVTELK